MAENRGAPEMLVNRHKNNKGTEFDSMANLLTCGSLSCSLAAPIVSECVQMTAGDVPFALTTTSRASQEIYARSKRICAGSWSARGRKASRVTLSFFVEIRRLRRAITFFLVNEMFCPHAR